jgi:CopG family transcriptional regulator / antitoxin EndoAI
MSTGNISFTDDLLEQIDKVAEQESRSRSELIREAARSCIERKRKWNQIFQTAGKIAESKGLTGQDISEEIRVYRIRKNSNKK